MDAQRRRLCTRAVVGVATLLAGAALRAGTQKTGSLQVRIINIEARKFLYTPSQIAVTAGQPVVLEFTSVDFVHGFAIPDMHIRADLRPGQVTRVMLPPLSAGAYAFLCDNFCGSGHEEMGGRIHVVSHAPSQLGTAQ